MQYTTTHYSPVIDSGTTHYQPVINPALTHYTHYAPYGNVAPSTSDAWYQSQYVKTGYHVLSLAGALTGAYHGYKRNHGSVGWAFGWMVFGGLIPILSIPLSIAEGFGEPAK